MKTYTEEQYDKQHGQGAYRRLNQQFAELDAKRFGSAKTLPSDRKTLTQYAQSFTRGIGLGGATDVFGRLIARSTVGNAIIGGDLEASREFIEKPTGGEVAGAVADTAVTALSPLIPAALPMKAAIAVGAGTGYVADVSSNFAEGETGKEAFMPGGETIAGAVLPPAIKGFSTVAQKALAPSFEVLGNSLKRNAKATVETVEETPSRLKSALKNIRFNLSDIDPQTETVLKRSSTDEVNRYFQQAKNAALDTRKPTPLELAGQKAEEAHDVIGESIKKAGEGKRAILNQVADNRVSGNVINDTMSEGIQRMGEKYGIKIAADGTIETQAGRIAKLDAADSKLVTEYFNKLNKLGVSPTVRQVDDFVDWAQGQLYKQSKSLSTLDSADKAVIADLKQVTGSLNGRLKTEVGNGYGEVNARMAELLDMQDELSKSLGADARKGGGLMKRLFSPTGGQTRQMFDQIYRETGIDLDKEANLARFAMDSVGDVRQKSLLQQLDAGFKEASELDLTKPLSWIQFIRERADLDEQELANEIIRRTQSGQGTK